MYAYSGKFDYADERGALLSQDSCQVSFDADTCVVTPGSGTPLAFDFGDADCLVTGEWDLQLRLYTGRRLHLRQFGKLFSRMAGEMKDAWRDRTVACLLLEDMEETGRFDAAAAGAPAQVRLYKTNLAVLPADGLPFQWRLADVDSIVFDEPSYAVVLERGGERLAISRLAKRTDEFLAKLRSAAGELREQSARAMQDVFPFVGPDRLQRLLATMPEGRSVRLAALSQIHPKLAETLVARAVDERLRPYFDALRERAAADSLMAGYKFIRATEEPEVEDNAEMVEAEDVAEVEPDSGKAPLFFWFFLPVAKNVVAWEASTGSGRATYFFRVPPGQVETAVASLTRGLALINFRREPVYLSDDSLERQPRFRRYAIGSRKLPELRALRSAMLGRAIHSSLEKWRAQVDGILG